MTVLRLSGFFGENRARDPMMLADGVGTVSRNQKPGRGNLLPWKEPSDVAYIPAGRNSIYRMGRDVASHLDYWLSWPGVVHAVLGFDTNDTTERTYYTGDGAPKITDNVMGLAFGPYPTASRPLGLPAPVAAPVCTLSIAGTGTNETYFYAYTYVNDYGWESATSPPSLAFTRKNDGSTSVSGFSTVPAGNYGINRIRVYRTQATSQGDAGFYFVREIALGVSSTTDGSIQLGEALTTLTWLPPPADLKHLTAMWSGMLGGISDGRVRFCEPYTPYAWPIAYDAVPPDGNAVALGVFGQTLLVLTTGRPLIVAGSGPDSMDQQPLEMPQGCIAARSAVSMGSGVAWASQDGLCWYGAGGPRILTAGIMLREDWLALKPETIIGQMYEGLYVGSYDDGTGGGRKGFMLNPGDTQGIYFLDAGYTAMHFDSLQDQLYVLTGTSIKRWDNGNPMTVRHKGKVERMPRPVPAFSCAEVVAAAYPVTFKMYADGALKHTQTVASRAPFRLPGGYHARDWQMEISGTGAIQGAAMAHSMQELAQI